MPDKWSSLTSRRMSFLVSRWICFSCKSSRRTLGYAFSIFYRFLQSRWSSISLMLPINWHTWSSSMNSWLELATFSQFLISLSNLPCSLMVSGDFYMTLSLCFDWRKSWLNAGWLDSLLINYFGLGWHKQVLLFFRVMHHYKLGRDPHGYPAYSFTS